MSPASFKERWTGEAGKDGGARACLNHRIASGLNELSPYPFSGCFGGGGFWFLVF